VVDGMGDQRACANACASQALITQLYNGASPEEILLEEAARTI
jgi:hypothetical protein